eukprot:TRINITY_DN135852_c0_g1_i1.p1 TRINITY_DN135852_c0_g1~~TRINITY_DN135852_c0_g1_i1.p1  ORF type:complete len:852 (+),score=44.69 TRINITY_DN135852_c0_g1_i1:85-2556(+)
MKQSGFQIIPSLQRQKIYTWSVLLNNPEIDKDQYIIQPIMDTIYKSISPALKQAITYYETYPCITKKTELCAYYHMQNKKFPVSVFTFVTGLFIFSVTGLVMIVFEEGISIDFLIVLAIHSTINAILLMLYRYVQKNGIASKEQKHNFETQYSVRRKFLLCALVPISIFMTVPLGSPPHENASELCGIMWHFTSIIQLHICTWAVGGILYKTLLAVLFHSIFCCLAFAKGYFTAVFFTRVLIPVVLSVIFFVAMDRHVKENFILKRTLKQQRNMYQKTLKQIQDPIIILDRHGKVLFQNPVSETQMGIHENNFFEKARFVTSTVKGSTLEEDVKESLEKGSGISDIVKKRKYYTNDASLGLAPYNKVLTVTLIESCSLASSKTVLVVLHDITDELAKEEEKYKDMLLFSLSHELKTPLNIFQGFLAASKKHIKTKEMKSILKDAKGAWLYLRNKINDILDYAQMISGDFALHKSSFSLTRFVRHLKKIAVSLLMDKRYTVSLDFSISSTVNENFEGDKDRLEQVLFNFLSNAVKFTKTGIISLKISSTNGKLVTFAVSDTGCGMSRGTVRSLFQLASPHREEDSPSRRANNLCGLGLTVSKMLCERMGTDIMVDSKIGKGSTFSFTLLQDFHEELNESEWTVLDENVKINKAYQMSIYNTFSDLNHTIHSEPIYSHRNTVCDKVDSVSARETVALIVDDNYFNRFVAEGLIHKFGLRTITANDGRTALEKLRLIQAESRNATIIIFMDLNMPIMDGIEATLKIREENTRPRPYIVALTAFSSESERKKCFEAGMDCFLGKPLTKEGLYDALKNLDIPFNDYGL